MVAHRNLLIGSNADGIEHDKTSKRGITSLFKDDAQLFKQFQDNPSFKNWLTDTVFGLTYDE